jgi:pimeloyl-ACP methyl ester carboxylesterase
LIADQHREAPAWSEAELGPWAEAKQRFSLYVLNRGGAEVDWPETLKRITCPTLLITSEPELGGIVTPDDTTAFQALVSQAQVANIPGAGHNIRREQFARYLEVVSGFLAELHR